MLLMELFLLNTWKMVCGCIAACDLFCKTNKLQKNRQSLDSFVGNSIMGNWQYSVKTVQVVESMAEESAQHQ